MLHRATNIVSFMNVNLVVSFNNHSTYHSKKLANTKLAKMHSKTVKEWAAPYVGTRSGGSERYSAWRL